MKAIYLIGLLIFTSCVFSGKSELNGKLPVDGAKNLTAHIYYINAFERYTPLSIRIKDSNDSVLLAREQFVLSDLGDESVNYMNAFYSEDTIYITFPSIKDTVLKEVLKMK